jgi:UDP-N-acetylmuramoyl-tripeptide--D-alanyl-D-alanine ligase
MSGRRSTQFIARAAILWSLYKRPVKRLYQIPAIGAAFVYRRLLAEPLFVGVTGSLGKTQTKALIAAVLAERGSVRFDPSTDNRTYDAAKNLLRTSPRDSACVQEIGMAGPSTMARPVRLFKPDMAVITNIRSDHAEGFATRRDHVLEKAAIVRALPKTGWAILNADEPDLDVLRAETEAQVLTYGFSEHADVRAMRLDNRPPEPIRVEVGNGGTTQTVATQLHGAQNAHGVLAAMAVARALEIAWPAAAGAIASVATVQGRMEHVEHADGVSFLLDDFKASEGSLIVVADYLREYARKGSRYVVLGSVSYGDGPTIEHYTRFIETIADHVAEVLLVGETVSALDGSALPSDARVFETVRQCADYLLPRLRPGDLVVLKGRLSFDHLRRIEISRRRPVNCWQMSCGFKTFCEDCAFMEQPLA